MPGCWKINRSLKQNIAGDHKMDSENIMVGSKSNLMLLSTESYCFVFGAIIKQSFVMKSAEIIHSDLYNVQLNIWLRIKHNQEVSIQKLFPTQQRPDSLKNKCKMYEFIGFSKIWNFTTMSQIIIEIVCCCRFKCFQ